MNRAGNVLAVEDSSMEFSLRFPESRIRHWAGCYPADDDREVEFDVAPLVRQRGYLSKEELVKLCKWKSPRSASRVMKNEEAYVEEVSRASFASSDERFKVEVLTLLSGVGWPTASVILHLVLAGRYPILDFRALWSLGITRTVNYDFEFWYAYASFCRRLAQRNGVSMRDLDRALWQYSKERQPRAK